MAVACGSPPIRPVLRIGFGVLGGRGAFAGHIWHVPKLAVRAASAALLLALALALHRQVSFWRDNITLWTHTLQITKANYIAEDNLAVSLIADGRVDEALPHLQRARSLRPDDPTATLNLASIDQIHGNYQAAVEGYANVLKFTKNPYWVTASLLNGRSEERRVGKESRSR